MKTSIEKNSQTPSPSAMEIAESAIKILNSRITDEVFLIIQNDRELMRSYLRIVEREGLDVVNRAIGRKVKVEYKLENASERQETPKCTLIQSYQQFE